MDKTPAYSIFLGLLIGAIFGFGIGMGALAGAAIAWFAATAIQEQKKKEK